MSDTARFDDYIRTLFTVARDRLDHDIRQIIAEQSLTSLESGKTVKRIAQAFHDRASEAVAACRIAGRRPVGAAHLETVLITEVDYLVGITTDALGRLRILEPAARNLVAKKRDLALALRTPPVQVVKPSIWRRIGSILETYAREITIVVVGGLLLAWVAARVGLVPLG